MARDSEKAVAPKRRRMRETVKERSEADTLLILAYPEALSAHP